MREAEPEQDGQFPVAGRVLITGPSRTGKTQACARALIAHIQANGPQGVAVLDFAPTHRNPDGSVLGERLDHFVAVPAGVLHLVVPTRAPRASEPELDRALEVAKENAAACEKVLMMLPDQIHALFVNDATMPFHVPGSDPRVLTDKIRGATTAVVTALDPSEFDPEHPITKQERRVVDTLRKHVDQVLQTAPREAQGGTPPIAPDPAAPGGGVRGE